MTLLTEKYGHFDAAFNYKNGPVAEQLKDAAPEGIDVYFDNVGGDHLEAAISSLNVHGRATLCGAIAQYNDTEPAPGPRKPRAGHRQAAAPPGHPRQRPRRDPEPVRPGRGRLAAFR
ncbi:zinc-binding dehydrogenase [Streptomyces cirratus]